MDILVGLTLGGIYGQIGGQKTLLRKQSINDSCLDLLEKGQQILLKSPYAINLKEAKELEKKNYELKIFEEPLPDFLMFQDTGLWENVVLPVKYEKDTGVFSVYYNLPVLIQHILDGFITDDPVTGKSIVHDIPETENHGSLCLKVLVKEHVKRQLTISHHLFEKLRTEDISSTVLSNIPYLSSVYGLFKAGNKLYDFYKNKKVKIDETMFINFNIMDTEIEMDSFTSIARAVPLDLYLQPYPYVISNDVDDVNYRIPSSLLREHSKQIKMFWESMQEYRKPSDVLYICRDEPKTPTGNPPPEAFKKMTAEEEKQEEIAKPCVKDCEPTESGSFSACLLM